MTPYPFQAFQNDSGEMFYSNDELLVMELLRQLFSPNDLIRVSNLQ